MAQYRDSAGMGSCGGKVSTAADMLGRSTDHQLRARMYPTARTKYAVEGKRNIVDHLDRA